MSHELFKHMIKPFVFLKIRPSASSKATEWVVLVEKNDIDLITVLRNALAAKLFLKFKKDPHLYENEVPQNLMSVLYSPTRLIDGWSDTMDRLLNNDNAVYINVNGGIVPKDRSVKVVLREEKDEFAFPVTYEDEIIRVSCWKNGKHWYLSSNKDRIFVPEKFDTIAEATMESKKYVGEDRIEYDVGK